MRHCVVQFGGAPPSGVIFYGYSDPIAASVRGARQEEATHSRERERIMGENFDFVH